MPRSRKFLLLGGLFNRYADPEYAGVVIDMKRALTDGDDPAH